jgi:hypothetical protein
MGKKSLSDLGSGSGMNISDHISESLETFFWDGGIRNLFDPGSGMQEFGSGIREKHPGSATLPTYFTAFTGKYEEERKKLSRTQEFWNRKKKIKDCLGLEIKSKRIHADPDPQPGFRIRIDLMRIRIRIRIKHFF